GEVPEWLNGTVSKIVVVQMNKNDKGFVYVLR
ncbi:MAG: hypothetical protein H6Q92_860, partial [Nitrospirae bacterium]|nr:hypothetical protein [Nitrospirota bacterium]